jgi:tetratricopeptide (TPR) repeat protein
VNTIQSQGGAVAVGGNVYDQRFFHLPAAPPSGAAFVVPYPRNPLFTGRDNELRDIGELLDGGAYVAVVGTGGLGKTQLAAEYAHAARARYPGGVFWLNMEQLEGIAGQVAVLAGPGGLNPPQALALDFAGKVAAVRAAWTEPVARLLIFDNLEDPKLLKERRPTSGGTRVLITSRRQTWAADSGIRRIGLPLLPRQASLVVLLEPRAQKNDKQAGDLLADPTTAKEADAICAALGDLPLAVAVAGRYLEASSASLTYYRNQIEATPLTHRSLDAQLEQALPTGHEASILKTFALSYDKLEPAKPTDALALTMLHRSALLAPAPIPRRLLLRAVELNPDAEDSMDPADDAVNQLAALGLIEDLGDEGLRLHRLLAAYARHRAPAAAEDRTALEAALIGEVYAVNMAGYPLAGVPYLPHLRQMIAVADRRGDASAAKLLNNLGYLLDSQGDLAGARPYFERALAIREQTLGPTHPDTARSLNNLGGLLYGQGDPAAALPLFERALGILEQKLGPDHPNTHVAQEWLEIVRRALDDTRSGKI